MPDYDRIAAAINFIADHVEDQPSLQEVAAHVHLSPFHFQRLFSRWAGVTPKRFLQVLTVERAKAMLGEANSLLDTAYALGLSSGSRLHDHFIHLEGMTPGEFKRRGQSVTIDYAVHDTPFGRAFIGITDRGVCRFAFLEQEGIREQLAAMAQQWPAATLNDNSESTAGVVRAMFEGSGNPDRPLSLHVGGTNFQINVWKALLCIPPAKVVSYSHIAQAMGRPASARAVGRAVGANPVAFLIPCHRIIRQNGELGGYRWGLERKRVIQTWEVARSGPAGG